MTNRNLESGIGEGGGDARTGGSAEGASRREGRDDDRRAIEGRERDVESGPGGEAARGTPPTGDVRSDANAGAGPGNGEPL